MTHSLGYHDPMAMKCSDHRQGLSELSKFNDLPVVTVHMS